MPEHKSPLDEDANLRKYAKLEVERHAAEFRFGELKARFVTIAWRSLASVLLGTALYLTQYWAISIVKAIIWSVLFSLLVNLQPIINVALIWREMENAKRESQSWDDLTRDYNDTIKQEDLFRETKI